MTSPAMVSWSLSHLTNLVALQRCNLLWQLLVGVVAQTQPAVIAVPKREELSVCRHHRRVFEAA